MNLATLREQLVLAVKEAEAYLSNRPAAWKHVVSLPPRFVRFQLRFGGELYNGKILLENIKSGERNLLTNANLAELLELSIYVPALIELANSGDKDSEHQIAVDLANEATRQVEMLSQRVEGVIAQIRKSTRS